jgi:hypothetical protein
MGFTPGGPGGLAVPPTPTTKKPASMYSIQRSKTPSIDDDMGNELPYYTMEAGKDYPVCLTSEMVKVGDAITSIDMAFREGNMEAFLKTLATLRDRVADLANASVDKCTENAAYFAEGKGAGKQYFINYLAHFLMAMEKAWTVASAMGEAEKVKHLSNLFILFPKTGAPPSMWENVVNGDAYKKEVITTVETDFAGNSRNFPLVLHTIENPRKEKSSGPKTFLGEFPAIATYLDKMDNYEKGPHTPAQREAIIRGFNEGLLNMVDENRTRVKVHVLEYDPATVTAEYSEHQLLYDTIPAI